MKRFLMIQPDAFTRRVIARFMALSIEDAGGDAAGGGSADAGAAGAGDTAGSTTEERDLTNRDDRLDAAMELWGDDKEAGAKDGAAADGTQQQDGEQADPNAQAAADANQIPEEQLKADPRFQELDAFKSEVQPLMERYGIPDAKEMDLQLADAQILYEIASGKEGATPSRLLDTMIQSNNWSKDQVASVARDLQGWLAKNGFADGAAAAGGKDGQQQFKDPLETRVETMERERREAQQAEQRRQGQEKVAKVEGDVKSAVEKFATANKVAKEDVDLYRREALASIPQDQRAAAWARFEKGNFVDLQKALAQVHNREVARLKRTSSQQVTDATKRANSAPRIPAGGAPPAPAGQQKRDLRNRDGRLAAAEAEWNK